MQTNLIPGAFIRKGWGFGVSQDFARTTKDTPIEISDEYAKPGFVIGYIPADPQSTLGFLRFGATFGETKGKVRVHVTQDALGGLPPDSPSDVGDESSAAHDPR